MCKTYKHTAGLGHDCINPKAILQLPVELRVRFIDLLMAFEAKQVKALSWSHMMVLKPKPSGGHHTVGLIVAPLRVLSRLRRPLAQKWGERPRCGLLLGAAKAKRATVPPWHTRSWWRQRRGGSSRRLFATGLGKILRARRARPPLGRRSETQFSNTTFGLLVRFIRRLAFSRGRQMRERE